MKSDPSGGTKNAFLMESDPSGGTKNAFLMESAPSGRTKNAFLMKSDPSGRTKNAFLMLSDNFSKNNLVCAAFEALPFYRISDGLILSEKSKEERGKSTEYRELCSLL